MTVCVVACSKTKRQCACAAKDMYLGVGFELSKELARRYDSWVILSAQYGMLQPTEVIEPYNLVVRRGRSLETQNPQMTTAQRRAWYQKVNAQLKTLLPARFIALVPKSYLAAFKGLEMEWPLKGAGKQQRVRRLQQLLDRQICLL